jgi:hypothetical protein
MSDKLGGILREAFIAYHLLSRYLTGGNEKNHKNLDEDGCP